MQLQYVDNVNFQVSTICRSWLTRPDATADRQTDRQTDTQRKTNAQRPIWSHTYTFAI